MASPVSAIVLTKNEEDNLPECLASLSWADECLVVDSLSTDHTVDVAHRAGVRVVLHPFANFAAQRNYAQAQALYDWILFIDADERVSVELRDEIREITRSGQITRFNAYHIQRVHLVSGRWFPDPTRRRVTPRMREQIMHSEVSRFFDRRQAIWSRPLHEVVQIPEPHGTLDGVIYHYATTNLSLAYQDFNYYTDLEAATLHRHRHGRVSLLEAMARGLRAFLHAYLGWRYFQYGEQGLLLAIQLGFSKFMNYAKLAERIRIENNLGIWTLKDQQLLERYRIDAAE